MIVSFEWHIPKQRQISSSMQNLRTLGNVGCGQDEYVPHFVPPTLTPCPPARNRTRAERWSEGCRIPFICLEVSDFRPLGVESFPNLTRVAESVRALEFDVTNTACSPSRPLLRALENGTPHKRKSI